MGKADKERNDKTAGKPPAVDSPVVRSNRRPDPASNGKGGESNGEASRKHGGAREGSGPKKGSINAIRHGLTAGKLPRDAKYVEVKMNLFRREVESACLASKGKITLTDAAFIQTALKWERHAALALRWLNKAYDEMSPAERLNFSREIAKASTERDKAIKALNLDRDAMQDEWSTFDGKPIQ